VIICVLELTLTQTTLDTKMFYTYLKEFWNVENDWKHHNKCEVESKFSLAEIVSTIDEI
jgi:hypothetical protein